VINTEMPYNTYDYVNFDNQANTFHYQILETFKHYGTH